MFDQENKNHDVDSCLGDSSKKRAYSHLLEDESTSDVTTRTNIKHRKNDNKATETFRPTFPCVHTYPGMSAELNQYIEKAKTLNFNIHPRPNVYDNSDDSPDTHFVTVNKKKGQRAPSEMKWSMIATALYHDAKRMDVSTRNEFFKAMIKMYSYLYGFECEDSISLAYFTKLWFKFNIQLSKDPLKVNGMFSSNQYKKETYIRTILNTYPELLHKLYRYATNVLGPQARAANIVKLMNEKCKVLFPNGFMGSLLTLTKHHFHIFFDMFQGKLVRPSTKPRLTDDHKAARVVWAEKWKKRVSEETENFYCCFLDEKWFYTTSRRKKVKVLPRAPFETEEEAFVPMPKLRSRRFPTKVMVQGIVARPELDYNFDGKIYIERVSENYLAERNSYNQQLSKYHEVNYELKAGGWKDLFVPYHMFEDVDVLDAFDFIVEAFKIDYDGDLCFSYRNYSCTGRTRSWVRIIDGKLLKGRYITNEHGERRALTMNDLTLHRNISPGTQLRRDTTCNSRYMLDNIHTIGKSIRKAYHWTRVDTTPIYLILDNAGGHGTTKAKQDYENILKKDYNIILDWQVPNSPETNLLDLGVWMAVQSQVEEIHRVLVMQHDVLSKSVETAFEKVESSALENIYQRWIKNLDIIVASNGGNNDVEKYRKDKYPSAADMIGRDHEGDSNTGRFVEVEPIAFGNTPFDNDSDSEVEEGFEDDDFVFVEDD